MKDIYACIEKKDISREEMENQFDVFISKISHFKIKNILIVPPDITRYYSMAGTITQTLYTKLSEKYNVDIMPALGTHAKMSEQDIKKMFGDSVPQSKFLTHNYKNDLVSVGTISDSMTHELSEGVFSEEIHVELNKELVSGKYDLVLSVGQVVPHEIVGMANYSKNIFIGLGGKDVINKTHMIGALYGIEKILGEENNPVRNLLDYMEKTFAYNIPCIYILTVTTVEDDAAKLQGLYISDTRRAFEQASKRSREVNITYLDKPLHKIVAYMEAFEYRSLWVANKSIYRTRKIIADGGELLVLAPGVMSFGENAEINDFIKKYGYKGTDALLDIYNNDIEAKDKMMALAHLMHGSTEGRFKITYAVDFLSKSEIENVGYRYINIRDALKRYNPNTLREGYNEMPDGEIIYFIKRPASGLWSLQR